MAKAFHGRIEDTVDALIILEGCRQGILPILNRRLLAAERGESLSHNQASDDFDEPYASSSNHPTHHRQDLDAARRVTNNNNNNSSSNNNSKNTREPLQIQSLIEPGSVFVFDEEESGICRWTDGRIWSPSRISGNFLVYRELLRKVPDQKCRTPTDKARMKNGAALQDKALKKKVAEEGLTVLGCMKGTFVLKKDGLIKKTICVKGTTVPMLGDLQQLRSKKINKNTPVPGFAIGGMQHLICYEKDGAMAGLHRPRDYRELRDLELSKSFITIQKYRNPMVVLPPRSDNQILDPFDEYVGNDRVTESHHQRLQKARKPPKKRKSAKKRALSPRKAVKTEKRADADHDESSSDLSEPSDGDDEEENEEQEQKKEIDAVEEMHEHQGRPSTSAGSSNEILPIVERSPAQTRLAPASRAKAPNMTPADAFDVVGHPYPTRGAYRRMQGIQQSRTIEPSPQTHHMTKEIARRGNNHSNRETDIVHRGSTHFNEHPHPTSAGNSHSIDTYERDEIDQRPPPPQGSNYGKASDPASTSRDDFRKQSPSSVSVSGPSPIFLQSEMQTGSASSWDAADLAHLEEYQRQLYARQESAMQYGLMNHPASSAYESRQQESAHQQYSPPGPEYSSPGIHGGYSVSVPHYPQTQQIQSAEGFPTPVHIPDFHPQPLYPPMYQNHHGTIMDETLPPQSSSCECCSIPTDQGSGAMPWPGHQEIKTGSSGQPSYEVSNLMYGEDSINYFGPTNDQATARHQLHTNVMRFNSREESYQKELKQESPNMIHRFPDTSEPAATLQSDFQQEGNFDYSWSPVDNASFSAVEPGASPPSSDYGEVQQALGANEFLLHHQRRLSFSSTQPSSSLPQLSQSQEEREGIVLGSDSRFEPPSAHCQDEGVHEDLSFYSDYRSRGGLEPTSDSTATQPMSDPVGPDDEEYSLIGSKVEGYGPLEGEANETL